MRVAELWRYPVKSLAGESLERAELVERGVDGDRVVRVEDERGTVTARRKAALLGLAGRLDTAGNALVEGKPWDGDAAAAAVRAVAGPEARVVVAPGGSAADVAPVLVTTDGALGALGEDRRRFRPNLVLSGVEGLAERDWSGRRLAAGSALLGVRERCERCGLTTIDPDTLEIDPDVLRRIQAEFDGFMGVYCDVLEPGAIAVGDQVELV